MGEVAWPDGPYPAWLNMDGDNYEGFLYFKDPGTGDNNCVRVTLGPSYSRTTWHVWHIEHNGPNVIVSPSIHYVNYFHTPNPVTFHLVSKKEYERG